MISRKVFVMDYDLISPLGVGRQEIFNNLNRQYLSGSKFSRFDPDGLPIQHGCEVGKDLSGYFQNEPELYIKHIQYDRKFELLAAVFHLTEDRLRKWLVGVNPYRAGVILGLGVDIFPFELLDPYFVDNVGFDLDHIALFDKVTTQGFIPKSVIQKPFDFFSVYLAEKLGLAAFQKTILTACTASSQSFINGCQEIMNGKADCVLVGGTDSLFNLMSLIGFSKLGVLAEPDPSTESCCRPFDLKRKGTIAGEAAGLCLLVSEDFLKNTNHSPLFEVMGFGNTLDSYQITAPDPEAKGMTRAIDQSLTSAGLKREDIGYINLHGTGTALNDPAELLALESAFGDALSHIPISSTKDRHGHAIAAAGIQELVVLFECMTHQIIPSTVNLMNPIKEGVADFVTGPNRHQHVKYGMTTNFSFGGVNTAIIVKNLKEDQ